MRRRWHCLSIFLLFALSAGSTGSLEAVAQTEQEDVTTRGNLPPDPAIDPIADSPSVIGRQDTGNLPNGIHREWTICFQSCIPGVGRSAKVLKPIAAIPFHTAVPPFPSVLQTDTSYCAIAAHHQSRMEF